MTSFPLLIVDRRPLPASDATVCAASGTVVVDDQLDDVEARWCIAVAQAQIGTPVGAGAVAVRRAAAESLIPADVLRSTLARWTRALDVAAALAVPLDALFHRLRWLTPGERDAVGAPMPTGWPPQTLWRFYRTETAAPTACAGRDRGTAMVAV